MMLLTDYPDRSVFEFAAGRGWEIGTCGVIYHHNAPKGPDGLPDPAQLDEWYATQILAAQASGCVACMLDNECPDLALACDGDKAATARMSRPLRIAADARLRAGYYTPGTVAMQFATGDGGVRTWDNATASQMDTEIGMWLRCSPLVARQRAVFPTLYDHYEGALPVETCRNLQSVSLCRRAFGLRKTILPVVCHHRRGDAAQPVLHGDEFRRQQIDPAVIGGADGIMWWTAGMQLANVPTLRDDLTRLCSYLPRV